MLSAVELQRFVSANSRDKITNYNTNSIKNLKLKTEQMAKKAGTAANKLRDMIKCFESRSGDEQIDKCVGQLKPAITRS
jgi:hypothetical protein